MAFKFFQVLFLFRIPSLQNVPTQFCSHAGLQSLIFQIHFENWSLIDTKNSLQNNDRLGPNLSPELKWNPYMQFDRRKLVARLIYYQGISRELQQPVRKSKYITNF